MRLLENKQPNPYQLSPSYIYSNIIYEIQYSYLICFQIFSAASLWILAVHKSFLFRVHCRVFIQSTLPRFYSEYIAAHINKNFQNFLLFCYFFYAQFIYFLSTKAQVNIVKTKYTKSKKSKMTFKNFFFSLCGLEGNQSLQLKNKVKP